MTSSASSPTADTMSIKPSTRTATEPSRALDLATHLSPLAVAVIVALAIGTAYGWIAFLFPLGPLLALALTRLAGAASPRGIRSLLAFTIVAGTMIGFGWIGTQMGQWFSPLSFVFPFALLLFTVGLVNFVMVTVSRGVRAWKGLPFDYPWIPGRIAGLVGLGEVWEE